MLANEQVIDGRGWRSGALVEQRKLAQWFLKITDFADELLERARRARALAGQGPADAGELDRPLRRARRLPLRAGRPRATAIEVFTTRPDTLFGASFCALSRRSSAGQRRWRPRDPAARRLHRRVQPHRHQRGGARDRREDRLRHRARGRSIRSIASWTLPVYVANFVLMDYGTGAIFGCPAHDQRDLDFARKYGLPVLPVVAPPGADPAAVTVGDEAYTGDGVMVNSRFLDGLRGRATPSAPSSTRLEAVGRGERTDRLPAARLGRLAPALLGLPDPDHPLPRPAASCRCRESDLPVVLPEDVDFDQPGNPLDRHPTWKHVACPTCGGRRERETDTLRHLRRFAPGISSASLAARREAVRSRGGRALAAGRPVYRRRRACDPAPALLPLLDPRAAALRPSRHRRAVRRPVHPGHGHPRDLSRTRPASGSVPTRSTSARAARSMSRPAGRSPSAASRRCPSRRRTSSIPATIIERYGADAARWFMLSDSPPERDLEWTEAGVDGAWRFVQRLWRLVDRSAARAAAGRQRAADRSERHDMALRRATHQAIAGVTDDIEKFRFNRAVARLYELANAIEAATGGRRLGAPRGLGRPGPADRPDDAASGRGVVAAARPRYAGRRRAWPVVDPALLVDDQVTMAVQVNGKLRGTRGAAARRQRGEAESAGAGRGRRAAGDGRQGGAQGDRRARSGDQCRGLAAAAGRGLLAALLLALGRLRLSSALRHDHVVAGGVPVNVQQQLESIRIVPSQPHRPAALQQPARQDQSARRAEPTRATC